MNPIVKFSKVAGLNRIGKINLLTTPKENVPKILAPSGPSRVFCAEKEPPVSRTTEPMSQSKWHKSFERNNNQMLLSTGAIIPSLTYNLSNLVMSFVSAGSKLVENEKERMKNRLEK